MPSFSNTFKYIYFSTSWGLVFLVKTTKKGKLCSQLWKWSGLFSLYIHIKDSVYLSVCLFDYKQYQNTATTSCLPTLNNNHKCLVFTIKRTIFNTFKVQKWQFMAFYPILCAFVTAHSLSSAKCHAFYPT